MEEVIDRHDRDIYRGNGKPGLTTRVAALEVSIASISANLGRITWMVIGVFLTGIAEMALRLLK